MSSCKLWLNATNNILKKWKLKYRGTIFGYRKNKKIKRVIRRILRKQKDGLDFK